MNDTTTTAPSAKAIDWSNITEDQLDNISFADIMGGDVTEFDINNTLPDGLYVLCIEDKSERKLPAKPEEGKKALYSIDLKMKITHVLECADEDVDASKLVGRYHFQGCNISSDMGKAQLITLILGALGLDFKNKDAWASAIESFPAILEQLIAESIQFGVRITSKERNGYVNTNCSMKPKDFVSAEELAERLG